ncbi:MAG TPA: PH domain-containing protein, partial [Candidatus Dormibacteraeota bacterium]|nr:PH domain-containing protein [Candidatus Dormibacteraeota bacterium]
VSTSAKSCPNCGYPVAEHASELAAATPGASSPGAEQPLAEIRPSWWGYFWHLFFFWLIIPPIIAYFHRAATLLQIYPTRIHLERGLFSKCYRDYNPTDIRAIDIDQSVFQRMVGIGDITVSTAATVEAAEEINSIPDPKAVRDLILAQRARA